MQDRYKMCETDISETSRDGDVTQALSLTHDDML